ncbi:MAG: hypothetical protein GX896_06090, partial [Clostridiales bacterium]|nr:hypothetical protein [Clostridiales bacterium]
MKNKSTKIISGLLAALMLLTGCQGSGKKEGKDSSGALNVQLSQYGQQITVEDIKSQYTSYSDGIMPLYNVARDEAFEIDFNFSYDEAFDKGAKDFVTVHTDSKCLEESMIYTYSKVQGDFAENMKLEISPVSPTLATGSEKTDYIYNDHPTWGNAPIFYIAIWYDTENSEITKLETPVVIPFTVKNEIEAPNVKGVVDNTGRFKLVWDPIEGAEEYRIYKLLSGQSTGISNHPVKGAEYAYSDSLIYDETTTELEFDNFAGAEHGLALHERLTTGEIYVI